MSKNTLRIGDIVHYVSYGTPGGEYKSCCRAAIVTEIGPEEEVILAVINPTGLFFNKCQHKEPPDYLLTTLVTSKYEPGSWHYKHEN